MADLSPAVKEYFAQRKAQLVPRAQLVESGHHVALIEMLDGLIERNALEREQATTNVDIWQVIGGEKALKLIKSEILEAPAKLEQLLKAEKKKREGNEAAA